MKEKPIAFMQRRATLHRTVPTVLLALVALFFTQCDSKSGAGEHKKARITGTISNAQGEWLYFNSFEQNQPVAKDSTKIGEKGSFSMPNPAKRIDFYQLSLGNGNNMILITDSSESVQIEAKGADLSNDPKVSGSKHTALLQDHYAKVREKQKKLNALKKEGKSVEDPEKRKEWSQKFQQEKKAYIDYITSFVDEHKSSPAALPALSMLQPVKHKEYFNKVANALEGKMSHSPYYAQLRRQIRKVEKIQKKREQQQKQRAQNPKIEKGEKAPEIEMKNPQGKKIPLSSLQGNYVLVDFWASWCKPCRIENPHMVEIYNKYKDEGFEIYAVSLDKSKKKWKKAIQKDGLPWVHVSDLQLWSSRAAKKYGVNSIPYTVLLDKEGKVMAKGLRGEELEKKLKEVLG